MNLWGMEVQCFLWIALSADQNFKKHNLLGWGILVCYLYKVHAKTVSLSLTAFLSSVSNSTWPITCVHILIRSIYTLSLIFKINLDRWNRLRSASRLTWTVHMCQDIQTLQCRILINIHQITMCPSIVPLVLLSL